MKEFYEKFIPVTESGCWLWVGAMRGIDNYPAMRISGRTEGAHRISYKLHHGQIPDGLMVLHKCDVRCCVNPNHLFLGTQKDNCQDRISKGRNGYYGSKGINHPAAKINETIVKEIRNSKLTQKQLIKKYHLSQSSISRILKRQQWHHVK